MAFLEETDHDTLDRIICASNELHDHLDFNCSLHSFKDPTFFLKDTRNDGILAFSLRGEIGDPDAFWEGSFGTTDSSDTGNAVYNAAESLSALTEAFRIASVKFPGVQFSGFFGAKCPWIQELVIGKGPDGTDDYTAVDIAIATLERLGVPMIKLDPPENKIVMSENNILEINIGLIYCHSVPLKIDKRKLNDSVIE